MHSMAIILVSLLPLMCRTLCPPFATPRNAILFGYQREGAVCSVNCRRGYALQGSATRRCQRNNQWSGTASNCVLLSQIRPSQRCAAVKPVSNGLLLNHCVDRYVVGCFVAVQCNPGFQLSGTPVIKCTTGGHWSATLGQCTPKPTPSPNCPTLSAPSGGVWVSRVGGQCSGQPGQTCSLRCRLPYTLVGPTYTTCDQTKHVWSQPIPDCVRT